MKTYQKLAILALAAGVMLIGIGPSCADLGMVASGLIMCCIGLLTLGRA